MLQQSLWLMNSAMFPLWSSFLIVHILYGKEERVGILRKDRDEFFQINSRIIPLAPLFLWSISKCNWCDLYNWKDFVVCEVWVGVGMVTVAAEVVLMLHGRTELLLWNPSRARRDRWRSEDVRQAIGQSTPPRCSGRSRRFGSPGDRTRFRFRCRSPATSMNNFRNPSGKVSIFNQSRPSV